MCQRWYAINGERETMHEAVLYKKLDKSRVQCIACTRRCTVAPEKTGVCGVRKNIKGTLNLMVYSHPVCVNVDPMEKKPLYHFLPGTEAAPCFGSAPSAVLRDEPLARASSHAASLDVHDYRHDG